MKLQLTVTTEAIWWDIAKASRTSEAAAERFVAMTDALTDAKESGLNGEWRIGFINDKYEVHMLEPNPPGQAILGVLMSETTFLIAAFLDQPATDKKTRKALCSKAAKEAQLPPPCKIDVV